MYVSYVNAQQHAAHWGLICSQPDGPALSCLPGIAAPVLSNPASAGSTPFLPCWLPMDHSRDLMIFLMICKALYRFRSPANQLAITIGTATEPWGWLMVGMPEPQEVLAGLIPTSSGDCKTICSTKCRPYGFSTCFFSAISKYLLISSFWNN